MSAMDRLRELFFAALDLPAPEREDFLRDSVADPLLRADLASLLEHHSRAGEFLGTPISATPFFEHDPADLPQVESYEILRELGRGGMGAVYLAKATGSEFPIALKILLMGWSLTESGLARFRTESRTASRLHHPCIVPVLDFGSDGTHHYIASAYIEGSTLARELDPALRLGLAPPPGNAKAVAAFVARIADALVHAHAQHVIHRDVKPSNILIDLRGQPHLTDFGLARDLLEPGHTRSGDIAGTVAYMSPEQLMGLTHEIDHRTDIFALGVVLFEMLSGHRPFPAASQIETARTIAGRKPIDLRALGIEMPRPLEVICRKALEAEPADRFTSMADFADDLEAFADDRPIRTRTPNLLSRARRTARRQRRVLAIASLAVLLGALGIAAGLATRAPRSTLVVLHSDPPGAEVFLRRMVSDRGDYGPPRSLGTTPLSARIEPGPVRFVLLGEGGRFAELSRHVPISVEGGASSEFAVSAQLVAGDEAFEQMIQIPAARFSVIGSEPFPSQDSIAVRSIAFAIDRCEVTVAEYADFLMATGRPWPPTWQDLDLERAASLPMSQITWREARDYAEWCGKRLPTYAEWQLAARGTDGHRWPWGDHPAPADSSRVWSCVDRAGSAPLPDPDDYLASCCPAGSHPADRSPYGVLDLLGSVREWVDTPVPTSLAAGPNTASGNLRMVLGAGWASRAEEASLLSYLGVSQTYPPPFDVGFRCARSLDPLQYAP